MIESNFQSEIGSFLSINDSEIESVGLVILSYPSPPSIINTSEILEDVETLVLRIPDLMVTSSKITAFLSACVNKSISENVGKAFST